MRAVITGGSSETGQILMENLDLDWVPVDRTHGYTLPDDADKLVELLKDADLFFNVANLGTLQSDFLALAWNTWNNMKPTTPKKIINFGSLISEIEMQTTLERSNFTYFDRPRERTGYKAEKLLLHKTHDEYKHLHLQGWANDYVMPQTILIKFGNILYKNIRSQEPFTSAEQLLDVVEYAINAKSYISDFEVRWD